MSDRFAAGDRVLLLDSKRRRHLVTLADSAFGLAETVEVLQRTWHVEGRSVRPDHRMVGHTGFLTHARLLLAEERSDETAPPA